MEVLVIDPGVRTAELDCYNNLVRQSPLPLTYHLPALMGWDSIERVAEKAIAGVIILGSGCSLYEGKPWQVKLEQWIKSQINSSVPILGICYGHQLVAHLFGAKVVFLFEDHRKLEGLRPIRFDAHPFTDNLAVELPLVVSHREGVIDCPKEMNVIAKSDDVTIEALAHQSLPVWGIQAHPEATGAFLKNQGIAITPPQEVFAQGHRWVQRFLEFCAKGSGAAPK